MTGMAIPLKESSTLRSDARFAALLGGSSHNYNPVAAIKDVFKATQILKRSASQNLEALIELLSQQLATILRSSEPVDPAALLSKYSMESLAAVELRNWICMELRAEMTMLEIVNVSLLTKLGEKILGKVDEMVLVIYFM